MPWRGRVDAGGRSRRRRRRGSIAATSATPRPALGEAYRSLIMERARRLGYDLGAAMRLADETAPAPVRGGVPPARTGLDVLAMGAFGDDDDDV